MERRSKELSELRDFIEGVDEGVKMILQNVKWDRKRLIEDAPKVTCSYDKSHKLASDKVEYHERQCFLKSHNYDKDFLLPDPLYADANTLIKLDKQAIISIINNASCGNPLFKQGIRSQSPEPCTLERLQATYTMDERRALHDAVVQAVPSCHDLADLALPSTEDGTKNPRVKSRAEILAELRNMKRRRAKYRVAAKTRKYSDVLRDVIKTQMELYTDAAHQTTANYGKDSSSLKQKTSLRDDHGEYSQNENLSCDFPRKNRNADKRTERDSYFSRDTGGRQQNYYSNSYAKNKDGMMSKELMISSVEEREKYNRNDYSTARYERRRRENNNSSGENHKFREPTLPEDARENRRRHEYTNTSSRVYPNSLSYPNRSRYDEDYDDQCRKRRKKDTSYYYSYIARSRNRHRENNASSERDEIPSRRKHRANKNKHSHRTTREKNTERDGKIRVKSDRDRTPDHDLSDCETRYDYVYSSCRPKREREISEEHDYKTRNREHRNEDSNISIKLERETPGRESNEIDTQSNYTRTSTYISSRHNNNSSSSESDDTTSRRDKRTRDYYKDGGGNEWTNVRIKRERDKSPEQEFYHHQHKTKKNRKRHKRHSSEEKDRSTRGRERESKNVSRYSRYGNDRVGETRMQIKKEKDSTPPGSPEYVKKERHDCQYVSTNTIQDRRNSNSSWE